MLTKLELTNFRSFDQASFEFGQMTFLVGPNGSGKSSVLEAIRLLSVGKSWRARRDQELVAWSAKAARIIGRVQFSQPATLELGLAPPDKKYWLNGANQRPTSILGNLTSVLFLPQDVFLPFGPPVMRRKLINGVLVQKSKDYVQALIGYSQILFQRNRLLARLAQGRARSDELAFWDAGLISNARLIGLERQALAQFFNSQFKRIWPALSGSSAKLTFELAVSPISAEQLERRLERDIAQTSTSCGPHLDDFGLSIDGRPLAAYGSQGQARLGLLGLKLAELEFLTGSKRPILLLDDIFSELDRPRRSLVSRLLGDLYQVIVSAAEPELIKPAKNQLVVELAQGRS